MATLTSRQTTLASGLIDKGYEMTEFKNRNVLKLIKGKTTIYLYPPKQKK
jgi:hypothetical protein